MRGVAYLNCQFSTEIGVSTFGPLESHSDGRRRRCHHPGFVGQLLHGFLLDETCTYSAERSRIWPPTRRSPLSGSPITRKLSLSRGPTNRPTKVISPIFVPLPNITRARAFTTRTRLPCESLLLRWTRSHPNLQNNPSLGGRPR